MYNEKSPLVFMLYDLLLLVIKKLRYKVIFSLTIHQLIQSNCEFDPNYCNYQINHVPENASGLHASPFQMFSLTFLTIVRNSNRLLLVNSGLCNLPFSFVFCFLCHFDFGTIALKKSIVVVIICDDFF
jgi:hypothetical protein